MNRSGLKAGHLGKIVFPFLLVLLVIFSGCSSSQHAAKGKYGQVPCPCEKRSNRR
jgi:hypothetical protein